MSEQKKKRIPYLDFLKFFAIVCVLLGHSTEQITGNDFWDNPIWSFIYSYHMPLFMLLCGYFFGSSLKLSFTDLIRKKFTQLIIPSLSAFAVMFLIMAILGHNPCPLFFDFSWTGFFNAVWFLKSVFFCYLIAYVFIKLFRHTGVAALTSIVLAHLLPIGNVDSVNFMLPMFWIGHACKLHQDWLDKHRTRLLWGSLLAFALMLPFWSGRLTIYMVPIQFIDWGTGVFDWHNLGIAAYRMAIGIAGSLFFFLLSPSVYSRIEHCRFTPTLNNIGKSTLGIYWVQTFLLESVLNSLGFYVDTAWTFIIAPVIAVTELPLCYQAVLLFRKNWYSRLVFLGETVNSAKCWPIWFFRCEFRPLMRKGDLKIC